MREHPGWTAGRRTAIAISVCCAVGCARSAPAPAAAYQARTREVTVTTVPLLVREQQAVFPFLEKDVAPGGVLAGKEVYAFSPSTIVVVAGDTIHWTFINPEDDDHSFVLPDLAVSLPPQSTVRATYVARQPGVYPFVCAIAKHLPMMWGQLVVLSPDAVRAAAPRR